MTQYNNDFQLIAESIMVSEDGCSLRLSRGCNKIAKYSRALFSQDAATKGISGANKTVDSFGNFSGNIRNSSAFSPDLHSVAWSSGG